LADKNLEGSFYSKEKGGDEAIIAVSMFRLADEVMYQGLRNKSIVHRKGDKMESISIRELIKLEMQSKI